MPSNHEKNIEKHRDAAAKRDKETFQRIDQTIQYLIKTGQEINFKTVSEHAGVSKAYLYLHQNIRELIETIVKKQEAATPELTPEKANTHVYEYYLRPHCRERGNIESNQEF
jgi:hypothetical protein